MRAVINTLAPSLGEEGTTTIKDLKRQMVPMEEENISYSIKKKKKTCLRKIPKKPSKIGKIWRLCFK